MLAVDKARSEYSSTQECGHGLVNTILSFSQLSQLIPTFVESSIHTDAEENPGKRSRDTFAPKSESRPFLPSTSPGALPLFFNRSPPPPKKNITQLIYLDPHIFQYLATLQANPPHHPKRSSTHVAHAALRRMRTTSPRLPRVGRDPVVRRLGPCGPSPPSPRESAGRSSAR